VRLTTSPQSCVVVMKSGNLNFLEPSGPLQACNGTAFYLNITVFIFVEYRTEHGRKRPKHVEGLPYVCISSYLLTVQLLEYTL
jgi:hypothetical protein